MGKSKFGIGHIQAILALGPVKVKRNGIEDGKVFVAIWSDGDYSFAISVKGDGLDKSVVEDMISNIQ